jgi:hypothetical protein
MEAHPRQPIPQIRPFWARVFSKARHASAGQSAFREEQPVSPARDFEQHPTQHKKPRKGLLQNLAQWAAWLLGSILAVAYLLWFFQHFLAHFIR